MLLHGHFNQDGACFSKLFVKFAFNLLSCADCACVCCLRVWARVRAHMWHAQLSVWDVLC